MRGFTAIPLNSFNLGGYYNNTSSQFTIKDRLGNTRYSSGGARNR